MSLLGMVRVVRVGLLTKEWPPDVYGGAGVHVEFLARELRSLVDLRVEAFAEHPSWDRLATANPALQVLSSDLSIAAMALGQLGLWVGLAGSAVCTSRVHGSGRLSVDFGLFMRPLHLARGEARA